MAITLRLFVMLLSFGSGVCFAESQPTNAETQEEGSPTRGATHTERWLILRSGVEYRMFSSLNGTSIGDGVLHVVRIDTNLAQLQLALAKEIDSKKRSAGEWCKKAGLDVAINAGMFKQDHLTNVGYLRNGTGAAHNGHWNEYQSVLVFKPRDSVSPPARLLDLDALQNRSTLDAFASVLQNLRLIKAPKINVWTKQLNKWSEAAIASDDQHRILFLFSRTPMSMWDFNQMLLKLDIGIEAAMHVEGGPEASLSIHIGGTHVDLAGSYETSFNENDDNSAQWPLPNVLGVKSMQH